MEITLHGIGVSPGIVIGPALAYGVQSLDIPKYEVADTEAELKRLKKALDAVRKDLHRLSEQTKRQLGQKNADIFESHLLILDDVTLHEELEERLAQEKLNVEFLMDELIARYAKVLASANDPLFRDRARDLVDVGRRIMGKLLNTELDDLKHIDRPSVVVAHDLSPSETAGIDVANALGIVTDLSGPTSHTAILARALEIPAVVGLRHVGRHTLPGDIMIVDGTRGTVVIRPSEETLERAREAKSREEEQRKSLLLVEEDRLSVMADGRHLPILANIELPVEIPHSLKAKAQGVGLYRTEYLFLNRPTMPTEEQQYQAYAEVAEAMRPYPVILRTLDLGGDKFASHLHVSEEMNPQLGWRGIRLCLARPDIFKSQLRAIFRATVHGDIQVMFPLISGVDELKRVKEVCRDVYADLERRGIPFDPHTKIGTMIEVPSAVAVADLLAERCDFFSIGTNDLIQYSLAVDRVNEKIAHMYEPAHPAVLRMISQTVRAARAARIPCGICGEMAGDPLFTELLVGLGVDSLSMSAVAIPVVRQELTHLRMPTARRFAKHVLQLGSISEIKALMYKRFKDRQTLQSYIGALGPSEETQEHAPLPGDHPGTESKD